MKMEFEYTEFEIDQKAEVIFVGHLPIELLFLMHSFLKSRKDTTLIAEVIGATKRENGLVVPCIYHGRSSSFHVAKLLKNELHKANVSYGHMKFEASGAALIKKLVFRTENIHNKLYV